MRLLALARRDEGETRIDRYPAGVLRANRYPGASIRPYFVADGLPSVCRREDGAPDIPFFFASSGSNIARAVDGSGSLADQAAAKLQKNEGRSEDGRESLDRRSVQTTGAMESEAHLLPQSRGDQPRLDGDRDDIQSP